MSFANYSTAASVRDLVAKIVRRELERQQPSYAYGTVTSIDTARRRCSVQYPGEPTSMVVGMGALHPQAIGQVVRVAGRRGDRHVADVLGPARLLTDVYALGTRGALVFDEDNARFDFAVDGSTAAATMRTGRLYTLTPGPISLFWSAQNVVLESDTGDVGIAFHATNSINAVQWRQEGTGFHARSTDGSIHAGITASVFSVSSTRASKAHIEDLAVANQFAKLRSLRPVRYWRRPGRDIAGNDEPTPEQLGFVAEEVADVYPDAVTRDDEGRPSGIDVLGLVAALASTVRELADRLEALEALEQRPGRPQS